MAPAGLLPKALSFPGPAGRLHARDWGGSGLPVLLLHGLGGNTHWWDSCAPLLAGLRPIALDFRGHGESDWAEDPAEYAPERYAGDVDAARRALGLGEFAIAAHSMGARVALLYAGQAPAGLRRLALLDFVCEVPPGRADRFARLRNRMQPYYGSRQEIEERFRLQPAGTTLGPEALRELAAHCIRRDGRGRWTWRFDWRGFAMRITPVWPALERVAAPTLVVRGGLSTTMPKTDFERVLAGLPRGRGAEIAGAHHHVTLDAPGPTAEALRPFLSGLP